MQRCSPRADCGDTPAQGHKTPDPAGLPGHLPCAGRSCHLLLTAPRASSLVPWAPQMGGGPPSARTPPATLSLRQRQLAVGRPSKMAAVGPATRTVSR